jgi:hypothetical protein
MSIVIVRLASSTFRALRMITFRDPSTGDPTRASASLRSTTVDAPHGSGMQLVPPVLKVPLAVTLPPSRRPTVRSTVKVPVDAPRLTLAVVPRVPPVQYTTDPALTASGAAAACPTVDLTLESTDVTLTAGGVMRLRPSRLTRLIDEKDRLASVFDLCTVLVSV